MIHYVLLSIIFYQRVLAQSGCLPAKECWTAYDSSSDYYLSQEYICNTSTIKCRVSYNTASCDGDDYTVQQCIDYSSIPEYDYIDCNGVSSCSDYVHIRSYIVSDDDTNCDNPDGYIEALYPLGCIDYIYGSTSYQCTQNTVTLKVYSANTNNGTNLCNDVDGFLEQTSINNECYSVNVSGTIAYGKVGILGCGPEEVKSTTTTTAARPSSGSGFLHKIEIIFMSIICMSFGV